MNDAEKERIKYFATLLNTCAAACFTIGVVGPGAAAAYGTPPHIQLWLFVLVAGRLAFSCGSLHLAVRYVLGLLP